MSAANWRQREDKETRLEYDVIHTTNEHPCDQAKSMPVVRTQVAGKHLGVGERVLEHIGQIAAGPALFRLEPGNG